MELSRKKLDIDSWARKNHFLLYKQFEEPFFGVCVEVDCTRAYKVAKENGYPFFLYYLYQSLAAANSIEPFRYRISDDEVMVYNRVDASPTINRADGTFGFGYMDYYESFEEFLAEARSEISRVQSATDLQPTSSENNTIHYSSIPWIAFTSLSHARRFSSGDSCPKITFGKMSEKEGRLLMPLAVHVHHALMDGYHVGQFIEEYQNLLNR